MRGGRWSGTRAACAALALAIALGACGGRGSRKRVKLPPPINPRAGWTQVGMASWYGHPYHGRITSNGERYDMNTMTAAHKRLPFDSVLRVRNLSNGRTTQVRINDRGPFVGKRIIDLSRAAAADIGMIPDGTARVKLTLIRRAGKKGGKARLARSAPQPPAAAKQPASGRSGRYDIQIGSFARIENARKVARNAESNGHRASVRRSTAGGVERFRVIVAGGSHKQAAARLGRLREQGFEGFLARRGGG